MVGGNRQEREVTNPGQPWARLHMSVVRSPVVPLPQAGHAYCVVAMNDLFVLRTPFRLHCSPSSPDPLSRGSLLSCPQVPGIPKLGWTGFDGAATAQGADSSFDRGRTS
jgi:hypothetical protein